MGGTMGEFIRSGLDQAQDEANRITEKIKSGEAANYDQAASMIERENFQKQVESSGRTLQEEALEENQEYSEFLKRLSKGEYLNMLESYAVKWDMEKASRDVLQNFFDANGGTLDGVRTSIRIEGEGKEARYVVRVEGDQDYDFRKLLHLGGTSKKDDATTAGGFGEGSKILSLVLLRDFGFYDVRYGSRDWELEYYLDQAPTGTYDSKAKGLFAKVAKKDDREGSYCELATVSRESAEAIIKARELFYSSENEDFQDPTLEVTGENGQKIGGFKFLGVNKHGYPNKGHFYDAGQRIHYENQDSWDTVEGVNIWSWIKSFGTDRDRGAIQRRDLEEKVISPLVEKIPSDQLFDILKQCEPAWSASLYGLEVIYKLLDAIIDRMAKEGLKGEFSADQIANHPFMPFDIQHLFREKYSVCLGIFHKIGMKTMGEKFKEMQEHLKTEPTAEQLEKINLLHEASALLVSANPALGNGFPDKEIWLYNRENEKSIFNGQYNESFVWIAEEVMNEGFEKALTIYYHEICHSHGDDQSANFSYALTDAMEKVMAGILSDSEIFAKFADIKRRWSGEESDQPPSSQEKVVEEQPAQIPNEPEKPIEETMDNKSQSRSPFKWFRRKGK